MRPALGFLIASLALLGGCSPAQSSGCHSVVVTGPMPAWADAGFSKDASFPHVFGEFERIVAVPFAGTLVASTSVEPRNKVLLIARAPLQGPVLLTIDAQRDGDGEVVHRERADGPGPGTLDMPSAGCWRMTLHWADQTDVIDLEYVADQSTH